MCVCVRERERERERDRDRVRETERQTDRDRDRQTETETHTQRRRQRDRETDRQTEAGRQAGRHRTNITVKYFNREGVMRHFRAKFVILMPVWCVVFIAKKIILLYTRRRGQNKLISSLLNTK